MQSIKDDLFTCSICFHGFDDEKNKARLLNCHHTFCEVCLINIAGRKDSIVCPLCCKISILSIGGIKSLPINYYLDKFNNFLDSFTSLEIPSPSTTTEEVCQKHHTQKFFWCKSCSETICIHCMGLDHSLAKQHDVIDLSEALKQMRSSVNANLLKARAVSQSINQFRNTLSGSHRLLSQANLALKNAVEAPQKSLALNEQAKLQEMDAEVSLIAELSKSQPFQENVRSLNKANLKLDSILEFFESFCLTMKQKSEESESLRNGTLIVTVVRPELKFDYGRLYCVRCGTMCDFPRILRAGAVGNPYGVDTKQNLCKKCGISLLEFK